MRLRPEYPNHLWGFDFVMDSSDDGRPFRMLNVIDEYTWECLAIQMGRKLKAGDVQDCLTELLCKRGVPEHILSDNGLEFTAKMIRSRLNAIGAKTLFIEPGCPWENGYIESFIGKLRDELLNRESFYTLQEVKILFKHWRREHNRVRLHSALGYKPPGPGMVLMPSMTATLRIGLPQTLT
jgi:putative transposase